MGLFTGTEPAALESRKREDDLNVRNGWSAEVFEDWRKARIAGARTLEAMAIRHQRETADSRRWGVILERCKLKGNS